MQSKREQPCGVDQLRKRAEAVAEKKPAQAPGAVKMPPTKADVCSLHELYVHQIELEMQNEELRKAQVELDAERERYFDLYDLAPVGYCTLNGQGVIVQANLTAASLLGIARSALIGQPFRKFILRDDQDVYYLHQRQLSASARPQTDELRMLKHDGTIFWARLEAVASQREDEPPVCRVVLSDITPIKRTEERLRESELHFRTLANSGQALIWTSGLDGLCNYFNDPWLAFTGRTLEQELGSGWAEGMHPDDLANYQTLYAAAFERRESFRIEYRLLHASGEYQWLVARGMPRRDSQDNFLGFIGHCLEISERKQAEEQIQETHAHLEEAISQARSLAVQAQAANHAKSNFLANMSHEIRTPLNGLMGMLQLMEQSGLNAEQLEYAKMALRSGARLTRLLSDILDLSRIDAGRMPLSPKAFGLSETFSALTESFGSLCLEKALPISVTLGESVPKLVVGDEVRIRQVLFNLVGNAMKFTQSGKIQVEVWPLLPLPQGRHRLLFIVRDTGVGIPDDKINAVCEPFVQAEDNYTRQQQGAGLGLSITRHLIQAMGGTFTIESTEGVGTSMYVMLPLGAEEQLEAHEHPCPVPGCGTGRPLRILLVEDDEISQLSEQLMLQKLGHSVYTANHGLDALEALRYNVFDCVLMDVQMNVMNGVEATRRIRTDSSGAFDTKIPIIAMTAYAMTGDRERFIKAGMNDHLPKPFGMLELAGALSKTAVA